MAAGSVDPRTGKMVESDYANWTTHPNNPAAVKAAESALVDMRGEAEAGQRTTFDVLTAQQTLLNARVAHVAAQRDRVVFSYAVLAATGRLTASVLNIPERLSPRDAITRGGRYGF